MFPRAFSFERVTASLLDSQASRESLRRIKHLCRATPQFVGARLMPIPSATTTFHIFAGGMKRMRPNMEPSASSASPATSCVNSTTTDLCGGTKREYDGQHHESNESLMENGHHEAEAGPASTLATSPSAASLIARQRPAYEKLAIGPLMVFGEMITGELILLVLRVYSIFIIVHGFSSTLQQTHIPSTSTSHMQAVIIWKSYASGNK